jgi:hypothetical protein
MCRKLIYSLSFAFALGLFLTSATRADLLGHWTFDADDGVLARDTSNQGNHGTINGAQTTNGPADHGQALFFDEVDDDVVVPDFDYGPEFTVAFWFKSAGNEGTGYQYMFSHGGFNATNSLNINFGENSQGDAPLRGRLRTVFLDSDDPRATRELAVDAVLMNTESRGGGAYNPGTDIYFGARSDRNAERRFGGALDDVRIYSHALSGVEVLRAMKGESWPYAFGPDPADGALHEDTWITLSWSPGDSAVSHDVDLGENFDDVNDGIPGAPVFQGNQADTFLVAGFSGFAYPDGLVLGSTYYWRIDEVNDADPNSPWIGDVWSFSIPPKTAYNPVPADGAGIADTTVTLTWMGGFGAQLHTVYFGDDFDQVNNATVGVPTGTASYSPGMLESEKVYYWRIDEFDGLGTYKGDVWAFTTPGAVGNPQPSNSATDVSMATILSWTAADNATSHEVYLGLDKDTVRSVDNTSPEYKGSKALGAESYDAGLLEPDTTYYWRVDEVYGGNPVKGPVWSFTVGNHLLVEDFESYTDNDAAGEAIRQTWIDGFGVADNGAQVGNLLPPYAEQTIVHGGSQSMPLLYINEASVSNSEAALTLAAPRDWTTAGVGELSLWFRGDSSGAIQVMQPIECMSLSTARR